MKVTVDWLDGTSKTYPDVESISVGGDRVLRLYGYRVGGYTPYVAEISLYGGVREWHREGDR